MDFYYYIGMETIKRQTSAAYGCLAAGQSPVASGLAPPVTQQPHCSYSCRLWRYKSVTPFISQLDINW